MAVSVRSMSCTSAFLPESCRRVPDPGHTGPVGAKGIRRRTPVHHLPPAKAGAPDAGDGGPPNIMWPAAGSGFEADPFSPAGRAQAGWRLIDAASRGGGRSSRAVRIMTWVLVVFVGVPLGATAVLAVVRAATR